MRITAAFAKNYLCGWAGQELARAEFDIIAASDPRFVEFPLKGAATKKLMLFKIVKQVLGQFTPNYPQEIGDCVSFGAKNAIEHLACAEIILNKEAERFKYQFPPYLYGTGRVQIGNGRLGNSDGSLGVWQAKAVMQYGSIPSDAEGLPKYSGSVAKKWGYRPGPPEQYIAIGKRHLVKSASKVTTWEQASAAILNGYPVTIASNRGFNMRASADGFHKPAGSWAHQMCLVGVDNGYSIPYGIILNSWGDVHGQLKDFETGENLPVGVLRVRAEVIDSMLRQGDSFAYSQYQGFPEQLLTIDDFKII